VSRCTVCDICKEHMGDKPMFPYNVVRPIKHGISRSEGEACKSCAARMARIIDTPPPLDGAPSRRENVDSPDE
jgi:hypothetical protein